MNKKEVAEIRKTLTKENCSIDKVCACYVTPNKDKKIIPVSNFLSLPEEEMEKYLDIFKKSLSGSIGKQLHELEFPLDEEKKEDSTQNLLYDLKKNGLKDDSKVEQLFDKIINNYDAKDYYCIIIMHANYDVVSKASDDSDLGSNETYSHIICSICPTTLSKGGLAYNPGENVLEDSIKNWMVGTPSFAFLFPTFTDRSSDIHAIMSFTKKMDTINTPIIETVLGCKVPLYNELQVDGFLAATQAAYENQVSFEQAMEIQEVIYSKIEENKNNDEPLTLSKYEMKNLLESKEATNIKAFEESFEENLSDNNVFMENLVDKKKCVIQTSEITITANPLAMNLISVKEVDGKKCIVITPNGDIEVNGLVTH